MILALIASLLLVIRSSLGCSLRDQKWHITCHKCDCAAFRSRNVTQIRYNPLVRGEEFAMGAWMFGKGLSFFHSFIIKYLLRT